MSKHDSLIVRKHVIINFPHPDFENKALLPAMVEQELAEYE
jgi:hypothetical protein